VQWIKKLLAWLLVFFCFKVPRKSELLTWYFKTKKGFDLHRSLFYQSDPAGIRTQGPYIKSVLLYQLSYGIVQNLYWSIAGCKNRTLILICKLKRGIFEKSFGVGVKTPRISVSPLSSFPHFFVLLYFTLIFKEHEFEQFDGDFTY
jgi:hypothetical protein